MTSVFSDMTVNIPNSAVTAQTAVSPSVKVGAAIPPSAAAETKSDTVELSTSEKNTKKGPIKTVKTVIANVKKFAATTGEYTKGVIKGIGTGAVAGSLIYTGGEIIKHVKPAAKVPNTALAIVAAAGALAVNLWNASLNATEKNSGIDHRWIGHNNN